MFRLLENITFGNVILGKKFSICCVSDEVMSPSPIERKGMLRAKHIMSHDVVYMSYLEKDDPGDQGCLLSLMSSGPLPRLML